MTPEEAIEIAIHCLGVQAEQEVCEECDIYGNCNTDCKDAAGVAIEALKEIKQYREIGTLEECREAVEKQTPKKPLFEIEDNVSDAEIDNAVYDWAQQFVEACWEEVDEESEEE